jgi:hypothetical protein
MRGIVGLTVTLAIALIIGVGAYQLGVAQGLAQTGTAVAPVAYYHPFFYGGFGFLFPLLFIFLLFFLIRGAFWGGSGRRYGGYGYYRGDPRERFEEWHKELHGEKPQQSPPTTPPSGR